MGQHRYTKNPSLLEKELPAEIDLKFLHLHFAVRLDQ